MIIITIKDSLYFVYDGISSQDMGIINVNIDSGLQSEPFYPSASILEISTRYNETPYFQKIKREPLVFNLTFAFEDGLNDDKLRETARWLNQKTFKELYFSNQPDKKYFAIYEGSPRLFHTGADGYFEITFRTNSPYAHSNLIETGIYNQVSPTFTFTRPSPAIHPVTGAEVGVDTPIFMPFSGDGATAKQGLLMEEGTKNLANNPLFQGEIGQAPAGWREHVKIVQDEFNGKDIVAAEIKGEEGLTYSDWGTSISYPLKHSTTYTISFYAKGTTVFSWDQRQQRGWASYSNISYPIIGTEWQKYIVKMVTAESGSIYPFWIYLHNPNDANVGEWIRFSYPQIEAKPYPTSFTDSTRANPTTLLTLPEALPQEFGIGIAVKPLWGKDDPAGEGVWRRAFEAYIDGSNRLNIVWYHSSKTWAAEIYIDGVAKAAPLPASAFSAGDILYFYFEKRADKFRLAGKFAGGEIIYTDWKADDRPLPEFADIFIGSAVGGSSAANAVLADFVIHDRPEDIDPEGYLSRVPGGGV